MKHSNPSLLTLAFIAMLTPGCVTMYAPPVNLVGGYTPGAKIPLSVEVRITPELTAAKSEREVMGAKYLIPLGESLASNTREMSRRLFENTTFTVSNADAPPLAGVDAVLIPKLELAENAIAAMAFSEAILTVMLEWTCLDGKTGKRVFVQTVSGEGKGRMGTAFSHKQRAKERIEAALNELFRNSFEALKASPEIKRLAQQKFG